jgi:hypothetical protein
MAGPPLTVGTGVAFAPDGGAECEPEPAAEPEAEADAAGELLAGSLGPPGLAATVPHPAASAPATSAGPASRAIELKVIGAVI